jgi:AcrR family transcriptional regulator
MNKALLHYYFRNKEKLFDKVFESALERYFSNMDVLSEEQLDFKERVHRLADRFLDFLTEYPQMALFLIKEVSANQALFIEKVEKSQKGNTTLLKALMDANRKGLISVQDPMLFFVQLISLCTYPFVAKPLFSVIAERNETAWNSDSLTVLRASIHSFIDHQLNPT